MKYTQEEVSQFFASKGCRLLTQYTNVKAPLRYIGVCGHEAQVASFEVARRQGYSFMCPACSSKVSYSDDDVREFVQSEGCKLLSVIRVRHEKNKRFYKTIRIVCTCGHEHTIAYEKFRRGSGRVCPICARPRGEKHFAYNANLTDEDRLRNRDLMDNIKWRRAVYERDGYTCQHCGDETGGNLVAHHLNAWSDYPEQRFDVNNGITLCESCHKAFHGLFGYGHNTARQYIAWTKQR